MTISQTCYEHSFLVQLLKDLISIDFEPVHINNDNQGAIAVVKNPVKYKKSKYIVSFENTITQIKQLLAMFRKMKIMQIFLQNQFESYYNRKLKPTLWFKIIIT